MTGCRVLLAILLAFAPVMSGCMQPDLAMDPLAEDRNLLAGLLEGGSCVAGPVDFSGAEWFDVAGGVVAGLGTNLTLWDTSTNMSHNCPLLAGNHSWSGLHWNGTEFFAIRTTGWAEPTASQGCRPASSAPSPEAMLCASPYPPPMPIQDYWRVANGTLEVLPAPVRWQGVVFGHGPLPPGAPDYALRRVGELRRTPLQDQLPWPMCGVGTLFLHDNVLYGLPAPDATCVEAGRHWWRFDGQDWAVSDGAVDSATPGMRPLTARGQAWLVNGTVTRFVPPAAWHTLALRPPTPAAENLGDRRIQFSVAAETVPWGELNVTWQWQQTKHYGWTVVFIDETALDVKVTITDTALGIVRTATVPDGLIPRP